MSHASPEVLAGRKHQQLKTIMKTQTKRQRQLINRAAGRPGSFMPLERAQSIARKAGKDANDTAVTDAIRLEDQRTKKYA